MIWRVLSFPRVINEKAARTVAAVVALTGAIAVVTGSHWLLIPLAYGFWARVLTGPRFSPLALLATKIVAPRLGAPRDVAGPPKRFAQGMGAAMTTLGVVALALGWTTVTTILLAMLVVAATLESVFAVCVGCQIFGALMRAGIIPEDVCVECADISAPLVQNGSITAAESKLKSCTRRVIEIHVPSTASSGCADCYPNAEIHVCAAKFTGSKEFEEHCYVPVSSTSAADCKSFSHQVEVYKKPSGSKSFNLTALKTFHYRGFMDSSGCRVAAKNLGQIHDTAEVYPNVTPPKSGTDVYRVLTLPNYKGSLLGSVIFIEFEKQRR